MSPGVIKELTMFITLLFLTFKDVNQVKEVFPTMDDDVIKSVLASNNGNKVLFSFFRFLSQL